MEKNTYRVRLGAFFTVVFDDIVAASEQEAVKEAEREFYEGLEIMNGKVVKRSISLRIMHESEKD